MVAASILPVAICNNELHFLFGKENEMEDSAKGFSDFGGRVESGESIYETALREGAEELCGFLGNPKQLSQLIKKNGGTYKLTYGSENKAYHVHIFFILPRGWFYIFLVDHSTQFIYFVNVRYFIHIIYLNKIISNFIL
jgi:hypothetical protein